jgi:hypothetical protein
MKFLKRLIFSISLSLVMMSFSQCASTQKLEAKSPVEIKEVYYKEWANPARYTGSGLNLYISLTSNTSNIEVDSVYFRKKQVKLEHIKEGLFVGKFKTNKNSPNDIIMSSDPKEEYGNTSPKIEKPFPFELQDNECVISYKERGKTKYFKLSNINKRQTKRSLDHRM